ncbi:hypothetical protein [Paractinoplanes globisporus]|uniref:Uncharacterized protein n=1 Tax=Paractinoplanes globisporus TaxID=113565 RepID=A0ABW6W6H4_9ACTN
MLLIFAPAACGRHAEQPPTAGDQPILVIENYSGLAPAAERFALPGYVLLADGTALSRAEDQGIVLSATRRRLSTDQIHEVYGGAARANLFRSHEYRQDAILDASAMVIRITSTKGSYQTVVVQPDTREGGARGRVVDFASGVLEAGSPDGVYAPDRVAAIVVGDSDDTADVRPWPLAVPADKMPGFPARPCLIVSGAGVRPLLDGARTATFHTRWSSGDRPLSLRVRPLLPYEHDCADLTS